MIRQIVRDVVELTRVFAKGDVSRRTIPRALLEDSFAVLTMSGTNAFAQVKRVQMHIGGYLCGN